MKLSSVALFLAITVAGCANGTGSAPNVPKKTIEKAADTKIADAGPG